MGTIRIFLSAVISIPPAHLTITRDSPAQKTARRKIHPDLHGPSPFLVPLNILSPPGAFKSRDSMAIKPFPVYDNKLKSQNWKPPFFDEHLSTISIPLTINRQPIMIRLESDRSCLSFSAATLIRLLRRGTIT
jgi:hypothetical protein